MLFKELHLPFLFVRMHVWVGGDLSVLNDHFIRTYSRTVEDLNICQQKFTTVFDFEGESIVVVGIPDLVGGDLLHEINHAYYFLCQIRDLLISFSAQEWHSYFLQWFFNQFKDENSYSLL